MSDMVSSARKQDSDQQAAAGTRRPAAPGGNHTRFTAELSTRLNATGYGGGLKLGSLRLMTLSLRHSKAFSKGMELARKANVLKWLGRLSFLHDLKAFPLHAAEMLRDSHAENDLLAGRFLIY
jgi:hypothetical protein